MKTTLETLATPTSSDPAVRIEWAGERLADMAEGSLDRDTAILIVTLVLGWADLGTEHERNQYRALAGQLQSLLDAA
jgi:hypothetical protein